MTKLKLFNSKTGEQLKVGDRVKTFRGESATLLGMQEPQHAASTGRVFVKIDGTQYESSFFPGVIGAEWRDA